MINPRRGNPAITLRLPRGMISAAKRCARQHDTTVSEIMRRLLDEQLAKDGIDWQAVKPTPGQQSIDDYTEA